MQKDKIDRQLIDLTNAKKESRNYCIKVCPKCGAVNPGFLKKVEMQTVENLC